MKKNYNVLVTSCGGDIGQSVGKILKKIGCNTFGLDISPNNAAKFIFDNFETCLRVSETNYLVELRTFIKKNKIDIVIPVSEPELRFYTENEDQLFGLGNVKILMADSFSRKVGFDKRKTCLFLEKNKLPYPDLYTVDSENIIFPFIAKPRTGAGSSNIFVISDLEEFKFISKKYKDLIFQEMLDGSHGEFTCCVYRSSNNEIRTIIFKRELTAGGYSGYGEVVSNNIIDNLLLDIAKLLDLRGSINVQLRLHKEQPVVFEINPRFSSTILFRHLMGFKDLEWSIDEAFGNAIETYIKPTSNTKFYKGFNEYID
jgi:carbamoyl-phosphate synthase large subunit